MCELLSYQSVFIDPCFSGISWLAVRGTVHIRCKLCAGVPILSGGVSEAGVLSLPVRTSAGGGRVSLRLHDPAQARVPTRARQGGEKL